MRFSSSSHLLLPTLQYFCAVCFSLEKWIKNAPERKERRSSHLISSKKIHTRHTHISSSIIFFFPSFSSIHRGPSLELLHPPSDSFDDFSSIPSYSLLHIISSSYFFSSTYIFGKQRSSSFFHGTTSDSRQLNGGHWNPKKRRHHTINIHHHRLSFLLSLPNTQLLCYQTHLFFLLQMHSTLEMCFLHKKNYSISYTTATTELNWWWWCFCWCYVHASLIIIIIVIFFTKKTPESQKERKKYIDSFLVVTQQRWW